MPYRLLLAATLLVSASACRRESPAEQAAKDSVAAAAQARVHSPEVEGVLTATAVRNEAAQLEASPVNIEVGNLATYARGAVRNGSADTLDRVVVDFDIFQNGQQVRQDSFNVYNVAPGTSAEYQLKLGVGEDSARVRGVHGQL